MKVVTKCPNCSGDVLSNYGEHSCMMCEHKFDDNGNMIIPQVCSEKPSYAIVGRKQRQRKYRSRVIYRKNW